MVKHDRNDRHERHDRQDRDRGDRFDRQDQRGRSGGRRSPAKFRLPKGTVIDYKDIALLQKYISDRGKILSRRFTGVTASEQREIVRAVKKARFLGLLTVLGSKRK